MPVMFSGASMLFSPFTYSHTHTHTHARVLHFLFSLPLLCFSKVTFPLCSRLSVCLVLLFACPSVCPFQVSRTHLPSRCLRTVCTGPTGTPRASTVPTSSQARTRRSSATSCTSPWTSTRCTHRDSPQVSVPTSPPNPDPFTHGPISVPLQEPSCQQVRACRRRPR